MTRIVEPKITTSVALTADQYRALAEVAHRERQSQGAIVRRALEAWLRTQKEARHGTE